MSESNGAAPISPTVQELYDSSNEEIITNIITQTQDKKSRTEISDYIEDTLSGIVHNHNLQARSRGGDTLSSAEYEALKGMFLQLLGSGKLEAWLNITGAENIYIFGADKVIVKYNTGESKEFAMGMKEEELIETLRFIASTRTRTARRFDTASPILDLQLPSGHRLFAVMAVSEEPYIVIRYHAKENVNLKQLVEWGTIDTKIAEFLRASILPPAPANILVGGGTSTGKTTTLRSFLAEVPQEEILVTIEDTLELQLRRTGQHPNCFELETRQPNIEGVGGIDMYDLSKAAMRMAPDRVIVGEVRGAEIMQLLNAMGQGNDGSIGTIHVDSSLAVVSRILTYSQRSDDAASPDFVLRQIGQTLDLVVFIALLPGQKRKVTSIREVLGYYGGEVHTSEIFTVDDNNEYVYLHAPHPKGKLINKLKASGFDFEILGEPEASPIEYAGGEDTAS